MEYTQTYAPELRPPGYTRSGAIRPARKVAHIVLQDIETCQALALLLMIEGYSVSFSNDAETTWDERQIDAPTVLVVGGGRLLDSILKAEKGPLPCGLIVVAAGLQTDDVVAAMRAGAHDVVSLPIDAARFISSVKGAVPFAEGSLPGCGEMLSPREKEVLHLVAQGLLSKQIADQLQISSRTVENHRSRIRHKLGVRGPADTLRRLWLARGEGL